MKQNLCTIPLSEVLEPKRGCPFCRMERMLEERLLEYILGPAMMEPDIRIRTNQEGFCPRHLEKMLARRNKLQTALLLETRLLELEKRLFTPSLEKAGRAGGEALESCFLCRELAEGVERLLATFFRQYDASLEFKALFRGQEYLCLPHYARLARTAARFLPKKAQKGFHEDLNALAGTRLRLLIQDVRRFTDLFDYQKRENKELSGAQDALERAFSFLAGESVQ